MDLPLGEDGRPFPHLVHALETCLGVPRHRTICVDFITHALQKIGKRHEHLLALVIDVSKEESLAALRLLHVSGVHKLGHILTAITPEIIGLFATARDQSVKECFEVIHDCEVNAWAPYTLPVGVRGTTLLSLERHAAGTHSGT